MGTKKVGKDKRSFTIKKDFTEKDFFENFTFEDLNSGNYKTY